MLCTMLCCVLVPGVLAEDYHVAINDPFSISFTHTHLDTGEPFVGYTSVFVKWDGSSWESSPVVATDITDSAGQDLFTVTEETPGIYYYRCHLPAVGNSWSNTISANVTAEPPPEINHLAPASAYQGEFIEYLEVGGTGFDNNARLELVKSDTGDRLDPINIEVVSENLITYSLFVEETTLPGTWDVIVTNPDNQQGAWNNAFMVFEAPPGTLSGRAFEKKLRSGGHYDLVAASGRTINLVQLEVNYYPISPQVTDSTGYFHFTDLAPGVYRVSGSWIDATGNPQYEDQEVRVNSNKDTYVLFPADYSLQMDASIKNDAKLDYEKAKAKWEIVHNQMVFADNIWSMVFLPLTLKRAATEVTAEVLRGATRWAIARGTVAVAATAIDQLSPTYYIIRGFDTAHEMQLLELRKIIADPPDYNYTKVYRITDSARIDITSDYTTDESEFAFASSYADVYNNLNEVSAIQDAELVSYERYLGALDTGDRYWMARQLTAVKDYADREVEKRQEIRTNIDDYQQHLTEFNQDYGDIILAAQANLTTEGFTAEETADLMELGFSLTERENYQQFLIAYNYSWAYDFYTSTGEVSDNRILYAQNLSDHASGLLNEMGLTAGFNANSTKGPAPLVVQFNCTSIGTATSWNWSFGDGFYSELQNPAHTYLSSGTFSVSLTVSNADESDTRTRTDLVIVQLPQAAPVIDRCSRIVSPGTYSLGNDIETGGDRNCIEIRSSDVVFDGMGHTIRGAAPDDLTTVNGIFVQPYSDEGPPTLEKVLVKNVTLSGWYHGMLFYRSAGTIAHVKASGNYNDGIRVDQCTNMTIRNVTADDGVYRGFGVAGSERVLIVNSSATGNTGKDGKGGLGIRIENSTHITVKDSNLHDNYGSGAVLINTTYSSLVGNNLNRNGVSGMAFITSKSVNATRNRVVKNSISGISLTSSTQNSFSDNYLNNTDNVVSDSTNRWNVTKSAGPNIQGGLFLGGNYWAAPDGTGFSQTCADLTRDGICDAVYTAGTGTTDYLPLSSFTILPLPGITGLPTDPDHDGIFEDLNANGRMDFADVVLYFNQMTWIAENEPIAAFDLNGNGRIDFADIVALFNEV